MRSGRCRRWRRSRRLATGSGKRESELLSQFGVISNVNVIKDAATRHLHLRKAEVDWHRLRDVEEAAVGAKREGKAVKALQNVRTLVLVKQFHVYTGRNWKMGQLALMRMQIMIVVLQLLLWLVVVVMVVVVILLLLLLLLVRRWSRTSYKKEKSNLWIRFNIWKSEEQ